MKCLITSLLLLNSGVFGFFLDGLLSNSNRLSCRNEYTGEELDWFAAYKLPKTPSNSNMNLSTGTAYTLITNNRQQWSLSGLNFNDTKSAAGQTISPLYSASNNDLGYILYNDQADKVTVIKGHTKGVILFDGNTAVWIVHSIPHFPPKKSDAKYMINPSQCVYGQSMVCMTFKFDELEKIGLQLLFNYPQVYDYNIPEKLLQTKGAILNNLVKVVNGDRVRSQPWSSAVPLTTIGGEQLMSFAKTTEFEDDLYSGLVAPQLKSNLLTETWNNGVGTLKSNCSNPNYHVNNIEEIEMDLVSSGFSFSVHHDHSKWAVTKSNEGFFGVSSGHITNSEVRIACIGDINRQEDQFKRGGGTVCFMNNENVWRAYSQVVREIQECEKVRMPKKITFKKIRYNISGEALVVV